MSNHVKATLEDLLDVPAHPDPVGAVRAKARKHRSARLALGAAGILVAAAVAVPVTQAFFADGGGSRARGVVVAGQGDGPELGTVPTPEGYRLKLAGVAGRLSDVPSQLDLLARYQAGAVTLQVAGHVVDERTYCFMNYDDEAVAGLPAGSGGLGCMALATAPVGLGLSREFSAGRGALTFTLGGIAPAGTRTVVVDGPGGRRLTAATYDSGKRWRHAVFFYVPWQAGRADVTALNADGGVLATSTSSG